MPMKVAQRPGHTYEPASTDGDDFIKQQDIRSDQTTQLDDGSEPPNSMAIAAVQTLIAAECDAVKTLLQTKNREYGNSALEPIGVFAGNLTAEQQMNVRIDDKLKRIQTVSQLQDVKIHEDTELDLIGYLILKRVSRKL